MIEMIYCLMIIYIVSKWSATTCVQHFLLKRGEYRQPHGFLDAWNQLKYYYRVEVKTWKDLVQWYIGMQNLGYQINLGFHVKTRRNFPRLWIPIKMWQMRYWCMSIRIFYIQTSWRECFTNSKMRLFPTFWNSLFYLVSPSTRILLHCLGMKKWLKTKYTCYQ